MATADTSTLELAPPASPSLAEPPMASPSAVVVQRADAPLTDTQTGTRASTQVSRGSSATASSPAVSSPALSTKPPPAPAAPAGITDQQRALLRDILQANVHNLMTKYDHVNWNFEHKVVGRTAAQSPLGLLLRPELNYGNLSRMTKKQQKELIVHALSLDPPYTPELDSLKHPLPFLRFNMSLSVVQAVYQGRVELVELMYQVSQEREQAGTGKAFDLRQTFFDSKITLLHMAAHDGQLPMARWILDKWDELAERDPGNPLNDRFTADVEDGYGQTPLFWTFARGTVSVELARFFVEERGCDLFRVFELYPMRTFVTEKDGKRVVTQKHSKKGDLLQDGTEVKMDGYCSAFSLAIQLAPDFVEEQLRGKSESMGTRFQKSVMKYDFVGITIRKEQVEKIQQQVDELNAEVSAASTGSIDQGGKDFLDSADKKLDEFFKRKAKEKPGDGAKANDHLHASDPEAMGTQLSQQQKSAPTIHDIEELKFLPQESQGKRDPKDRWDNFFYEKTPMSAVELMVQHRRRRMLLTNVMQEVQQRLWDELYDEFYWMSGLVTVGGLLFAVNTALWPRTAELLDPSVTPFAQSISDSAWRGCYLATNLGCALITLFLLGFYTRVVVKGTHPIKEGEIGDRINNFGRNFLETFSESSAIVDAALFVIFWLVEALQWSLICHVQQFAAYPICGSGPADLLPERVGVLAWLQAAMHLLLGLKLLELLSVLSWVGPLYSTLVGMVNELGRFLTIFIIGFCAFACAAFVVLKDVFGPAFQPQLQLKAPAAAAAAGSDGEPTFTYGTSIVRVLLWVFMSFDFDSLSRTPVWGVSALGRVLLFCFLLIMVLVMLNVMVAMFSNTYADVVKDSDGEAALRRIKLLAQLLRLAGGKKSEAARHYVSSMGVANNCGIDRDMVHDSHGSVNAEASAHVALSGSVQGARDGANWAETVNTHFLQAAHDMKRMRLEMAQLQKQVERLARNGAAAAQQANAPAGAADQEGQRRMA